MICPTLYTERLMLRPHVMSDWQPMAAFLGSEAARYIGGPYDRPGSWHVFASDAGAWDLLGCGGLAVVERMTVELVGQVGLNRPPHFPEPEIGWITFPGYQRRGYAHEAVLRARAFAFETLGWSTAVSYIEPANAASIALARSLGCIEDPDAPRVAGDEADLVFRHVPDSSANRVSADLPSR